MMLRWSSAAPCDYQQLNLIPATIQLAGAESRTGFGDLAGKPFAADTSPTKERYDYIFIDIRLPWAC